jgi:hypothetical protein
VVPSTSSEQANGQRNSTAELERALADSAVAEFPTPPSEIDRDRDLPDVAGDGSRRDIGRVGRHLHASGESVGTIEIAGRLVDVLPFLVVGPDPDPTAGREGIEKALGLD